MKPALKHALTCALAGVATLSIFAGRAHSAESMAPPNEGPNPYKTIAGWAQMPEGRKWGSTAGVDIGPDGNIWAYDRCGANSCADSKLDPILEFDQKTGKLMKSFGAGMFVMPHGFFVDKQGNVWVTDEVQSKDQTRGLVVVKMNQDGKVLLTLGKAGVKGDGPDTFSAPSDVVVAPNGDIFVADGHTGCNCTMRIVKFDKNGKFIKTWGKTGKDPGDFDGPHALAFDTKGRLFVGDRTNNRIQIFDQDGKFIAEWKQFGRPSGIFIDKSDTIYVTDSESQSDRPTAYGYNPGCHRGIRIGSAKTGKVTAYIPDPEPKGGTSISEGVAVDHQGNVYGAEVGPKDLKKYAKN
jgi:streptogramin lyase